MKNKLDSMSQEALDLREDGIKYEIKVLKCAITKTLKQGIAFKGLVETHQRSLDRATKELQELQQLRELVNKFDLQVRF